MMTSVVLKVRLHNYCRLYYDNCRKWCENRQKYLEKYILKKYLHVQILSKIIFRYKIKTLSWSWRYYPKLDGILHITVHTN